MTRNKIYEALLTDVEPCSLSPAWGGVECHPAFVRLPEDMTLIIERLRGMFQEEEIVESGVLLKAGDGASRINPLLIKHRDFILVTERAGEVGPHQLVAGLKAVGQHNWCVMATLIDLRMSEMFENFDSRIFVAFSQADLAAAWSIGIPAIPSMMLDNLGGTLLDHFCKSLKLRRASTAFNFDVASPVATPIYPVLINWSLAELELKEHPAARAVEQHLVNLQRHLGIDFSDSAVWTPSAEELESIKFRVKHGARDDVLEALIDSSSNCECFGLSPSKKARLEPQRYVDAVRDFTACAAGSDTLRRQKSWDRVLQLQESELIAPLMNQAEEEQNALRRTLLTSLAEMSRMFHPQTMLLSAQLAKNVRDQGAKATAELPAEEFRQLVALSDRILAMAQGAQSCRSKKAKSSKNCEVPPTTSQPSDSAMMKLPR